MRNYLSDYHTFKPILPAFLATYAVFLGAIAAQLNTQAHHGRDLHTFLATLFTISCSRTPQILLSKFSPSTQNIARTLQSQSASNKSLSTIPGTINILAAVSRVESSFQILPVCFPPLALITHSSRYFFQPTENPSSDTHLQ